MATPIREVSKNVTGALAPCPQKGLSKRVYQTIDACGQASFIEVQKYLPAAMVRNSIKYDRVKLERCLSMLEYRGFIQKVGDKYRIAPYEYFAVRDEWLTKNTTMNTPPTKRGRPGRRRARPGPRIANNNAVEYDKRLQAISEAIQDDAAEKVRELDIAINWALTAAAFAGGLIIGGAIGVLV